MYCPKCAQPQVSEDMPFCSRCGLPLSNLKAMISGDVQIIEAEKSEDRLSPRQRGIRQATVLILLSIILIPAYILLAALFPAEDRLVESAVSDTPFEKISQAVLFTIFMFGVARMLYARFFQRGEDTKGSEVARLESAQQSTLPPVQSIPVSGYGVWRSNTGDMARQPSGTRNTDELID